MSVTIPKLLREEILVAARRSYGWLRDHAALASAASPHELGRGLEWLIAAWICEQTFELGSRVRLSREGALQLALRINGRERSWTFGELFTCDPFRVMLGHTIMIRNGVACDTLTAFVDGLVASLPAPPEDVAGGDDLFETRLLVALAGLGQMPRLPCLDTLIDATTLDLLQADDLTIHGVVSQVITGSAYGTREPVISTSFRRRLIEVMSVWLLDFARCYRLDNVAFVMRSLGCLGESSAMLDAMRFLLAQHHPSGHFGFFGPEAARAKRLSPTWDEAASLHLPVTFACLWALSECGNGSFRLLGTVV